MTTESKLRAALEKIANSTFSDLNSQNIAREALPQSTEESGQADYVFASVQNMLVKASSCVASDPARADWHIKNALTVLRRAAPTPTASTAEEEVE